MAHAEICPVCNGRGYINEYGYKGKVADAEPKCHGCDGRGWVTVHDEYIPSKPLMPLQFYYPVYYSSIPEYDLRPKTYCSNTTSDLKNSADPLEGTNEQ